MLEDFVFTGRELLLPVILASQVYLLEVWLFSRKSKGSKGAPPSEKRIKALETEIEILKQRLQALEDMPRVGSSLDARANTYADAQRMAREGTPAQELAGSLGISRGEAELIVALQRAENQSP